MVKISAPLGNLEQLDSILNAHPDAVYAGLLGWSRGRQSSELSSDDISVLIRRCRKTGTEVHICLNCVPGEFEVDLFLETVGVVAELEPHAVVLSDLGAIHLVHKKHPEITIFGSIGLCVRNDNDLVALAELGCSVACVSPGVLADLYSGGGTPLPTLGLEVLAEPACLRILPGTCMLSGYVSDEEDRIVAGRRRSARSGKRGGECHLLCRQFFEKSCEEVRKLETAGVSWIKLAGRDRLTSKGLPDLIHSLSRNANPSR